MTLHGFPAASTPDGISLVTTLPAPITEPQLVEEKNIFVFVLDTYSNDFIDEMTEQYPDALEPLAVIPICVAIMFGYWYKRVEYLCPECHTRFQPKKLEAFFGNHTPKTRKLTCPTCRRRIWSLEVYRKEVDA